MTTPFRGRGIDHLPALCDQRRFDALGIGDQTLQTGLEMQQHQFRVELEPEGVAKRGLDGEAAEDAVRALGFRVVRVRHLEAGARVEVGAEELGRLQDAGLRAAVLAAVQAAGYERVEIDAQGYRRGSLHEGLRLRVLAVEPKLGV